MGGGNAQKSATARLRNQAAAGAAAGAGGGGDGREKRGGDTEAKMAAGVVKREEMAAKKAQLEADKQAAAEKLLRKHAKEERVRVKAEAAKKKAAAPVDPQKAVARVAMPKVKKAEALAADGNYADAIALVESAIDDFKKGGFERPKLQEKVTEWTTKL